MHVIPPKPNYEATVKFSLEGNTEGWLAMYYDQDNFAGIAKNSKAELFAISKGRKYFNFISGKQDIHYLKIKLHNYILSMEYSKNGKN